MTYQTPPTSSQIQTLVNHAIKWRSSSAQELRKLVTPDRFEEIMNTVSEDRILSEYVYEHGRGITSGNQSLSLARTGDFRGRLLKLLTATGEPPDGHDNPDTVEDFWNKVLRDCAHSIRDFYTRWDGWEWFILSSIEEFSQICIRYMQGFSTFYWKGDAPWGTSNETEFTATVDEDKEDDMDFATSAWEETQHQWGKNFLKEWDIRTLHHLLGMLRAYVSLVTSPPSPKTSPQILREESDNGRWSQISRIVQQIKAIPKIWSEINDCYTDLFYILDDFLDSWEKLATQKQYLLEQEKGQ